MKHLATLSRYPSRAQNDLCSGFESDFQVQLCFLLEVLQTIFPAFVDSKRPTQQTR